MKTYLVKSTTELLIFENIVRIDLLWSNVVLEKEVIFNQKFESEKGFRHKAFPMHLKAHNSMQQGCFFLSFIIFLQLRWPIEPKFPKVHVYVILCIGWDTPKVRILVFDNYQKFIQGGAILCVSVGLLERHCGVFFQQWNNGPHKIILCSTCTPQDNFLEKRIKEQPRAGSHKPNPYDCECVWVGVHIQTRDL